MVGRASVSILGAIPLVIAWLLLCPPGAGADEIGIRIGAGIGAHTYSSQEIYWRPYLDQRWGAADGWHLRPFAELNAGRLSRRGDSLLFGGGALGVWARNPGSPFSFSVGTGPTYLSETELAGRDFGGHWQFTSHIGARLRLGPRLSAGYRIQHTSNAGLYSADDGYTVQVIEIRTRF